MAFVSSFIISALGRSSSLTKFDSNTSSSQQRFVRPTTRRNTRMTTTVGDNVKNVEVRETNVTPNFAVYSTKGMSIEDFFTKSLGDWKSQRSSHNLAWAQFEAVTSEINISSRSLDDEEVIELCAANEVDVKDVTLALSMEWEGESDWDDDDDKVMKGSTVMAVVKDTERTGRLLRSIGYAEEIPAVGNWEITDDGVFVLITPYEAAAAEERIWFATDDLRMRVSQIRTSSGRGVVTASFSTEIRKLNLDK